MVEIMTSRVVIGGGLFGAFAALHLAEQGHDVVLIEREDDFLQRASLVNQARLHTGLHYPRSLLTARDALRCYSWFLERFPGSLREFRQIYALARFNSKTSEGDFSNFLSRLGGDATEVAPNQWFKAGTVTAAYEVTEPAFDADVLRQVLKAEISACATIKVLLGTAVQEAESTQSQIRLVLSEGTRLVTDGLVICTYAATNSIRTMMGLAPMNLTYELTEVIIGKVGPALQGLGFTVMDGPFWSLMPFGHGDEVSLTSVGFTPLQRNAHEPAFECQQHRHDCTPSNVQLCDSCKCQPPSAVEHQIQQMQLFLKDAESFFPKKRLLTVKTVLSASDVDDARPTIVQKDPGVPVWTVLSGKVSTLVDLEGSLT